ncbi:hypothetical protein AAMO2058_000339000 [Amorphochlora amoebiformis]
MVNDIRIRARYGLRYPNLPGCGIRYPNLGQIWSSISEVKSELCTINRILTKKKKPRRTSQSSPRKVHLAKFTSQSSPLVSKGNEEKQKLDLGRRVLQGIHANGRENILYFIEAHGHDSSRGRD